MKKQGNKTHKNITPNFWKKPIGQILISVIAGAIMLFIGIFTNRMIANNSVPDKIITTQTDTNNDTQGIKTSNEQNKFIHQPLTPIMKNHKPSQNVEATFKIQTSHPFPKPKTEVTRSRSFGFSIRSNNAILRNNVVRGAEVGYDIQGNNVVMENNKYSTKEK